MKVMVVENLQKHAEVLAIQLRGPEYELVVIPHHQVVRDPEVLLRKATDIQPDLILLDAALESQVTGPALCDLLIAAGWQGRAKIALWTNYPDRPDVVACSRRTGVPIIRKTNRTDRLRAELDSLAQQQ